MALDFERLARTPCPIASLLRHVQDRPPGSGKTHQQIPPRNWMFRLSMTEIAVLDKRTLELELRRDKILRRIEDHRAGLAIHVAAKLDQRLEDEAVMSAGAGAD